MSKLKNILSNLVLVCMMLLLGGCFPDTPVVPAPITATPSSVNVVMQEDVAPMPVSPTKEEVLVMREAVREGMDRNDFEQLGERIKEANLWMENAYVYKDLFELLEDENHECWERDCSGFVEFVSNVKETVQHEKFRQDLQYILDQIQLAKDTRKMEYANNLYKALHDMDYFLFRYGLEDVGIYVKEKGILAKYYGVLNVYHDAEE